MQSTLRLFALLLACPLLTAPLTACDPEAEATGERPPSRLAERRALARAHAAGDATDRLAAERMLLVDPQLTADADQVRYILAPGELSGEPATLTELRAELRGKPTRETLHGGQDAARQAIFDDVAPGTYTVCVVAGPPRDPATDAWLARAAANYEADTGGALSADRLRAAIDRTRDETGTTPKKIVLDDLPPRCRRIEVTADPSSRAVTLGDA